MTRRVIIRSYFSLPTDLAGEMRDWPEFVTGDGYSVNLRNPASGEAVDVRYAEEEEDCYIVVSATVAGPLFERVLGRVVYALSAHSDNLMVDRIT